VVNGEGAGGAFCPSEAWPIELPVDGPDAAVLSLVSIPTAFDGIDMTRIRIVKRANFNSLIIDLDAFASRI
jgi:hypothetical protein